MPPKDQGAAPKLDEHDVVKGGPGVDPPEEPEQPNPARKKVKLSGSEFEVDDALATALAEREEEFKRKLSEQAEELRRPVTQEPPVQPKKDAKKPFSERFFDNPDEAISELRQEIVNEVTQMYVRADGIKQFWTMFYDQNPDLKPAQYRRIAQIVMQEHQAEWSHLKVNQVIPKLAAETRDAIFQIVEEQKDRTEDGNTPKRKMVVEGPSNTSVAPQKTKEIKQRSLGDLIMERRAARAKSSARVE